MQTKLNLLVSLRAYADSCSSQNPTLNYANWTRNLNGISVSSPISQAYSLAPQQTLSIFNGARTLTQSGSTQYSIAPKVNTTNTYILTNVAGTAPNFRTARTVGGDATTQVQVTINGSQSTYTSIGGTAFNLISGGCVVGDTVFINSGIFAAGNQGNFTIISLTATSFTVENGSAVAETQTLGAGYGTQIQIFSSTGVQVGDTLQISSGFSLISQNSFEITAVYPESLEFFSATSLPTESGITTQVAVYFAAKNLVYVESDQNTQVTINGASCGIIAPWTTPNGNLPGQFMLKQSIFSLSLTNNSLNTANIYVLAVD
jgi:hypothetical protein